MIQEKRLPENIIEKIPAAVGMLKDNEYINALFFFGSLVCEELRPLSDIDVAVLFYNYVQRKQFSNLQLEIAGILEDALKTQEFDLVVLNSAPLRFAYNILKDGQLVFVKNREQLIEFRERTIKYHLDFQYYRNEFDKAYLEGVGYHG